MKKVVCLVLLISVLFSLMVIVYVDYLNDSKNDAKGDNVSSLNNDNNDDDKNDVVDENIDDVVNNDDENTTDTNVGSNNTGGKTNNNTPATQNPSNPVVVTPPLPTITNFRVSNESLTLNKSSDSKTMTVTGVITENPDKETNSKGDATGYYITLQLIAPRELEASVLANRKITMNGAPLRAIDGYTDKKAYINVTILMNSCDSGICKPGKYTFNVNWGTGDTITYTVEILAKGPNEA